MKATIQHNTERINIDTKEVDISTDELISICLEKISEYYKNHRNQIIIGDQVINVKIELVQNKIKL